MHNRYTWRRYSREIGCRMKIFIVILLALMPSQLTGIQVPRYFGATYYRHEPTFELRLDHKVDRRRKKQPPHHFPVQANKGRRSAKW